MVSADLGVTYEIAEPDLLQEMKQRASRIDWKSKWEEIDVGKAAQAGGVRLPKARENREYKLDLTYTLERDIPDGKGGVLYPKGYRFNPAAYIKLPYRLAVITDRPEDMDWARKQEGTVIWMSAGGDPIDMTRKLGKTVYLYTNEVDRRFGIKATPSMITQKGQELWVRQYALEPVQSDQKTEAQR